MKKISQIAVVCNYKLDPNRIGGMDRFFKAYNENLIRKGYNVSWYFSGGEPFNFYKSFNLYFAQEESVEDLFLGHLEKLKTFDVVVTHFVALCTPFYKKVKKRNQSYVIAVDHNPRPVGGFPLKKRMKNRIKGKRYSKYIDRFVGVSQYTANYILRDYGQGLKNKTIVIYNGVDTSVYIPRREVHRGRFIVASHLRRSKGIHDLIDAVGLLEDPTKKTIRIDIFGQGPEEKNLRDQVTEKGLEAQFTFNGSSSRLPKEFHYYSYLLQPTYMECFSLSILESLASNLPVITTSVGGNPEIITNGENGYLFKPGKVKVLRNIIQQVMDKEIGIENDVRQLVEDQFTLEQMVAGHIKLIPCT